MAFILYFIFKEHITIPIFAFGGGIPGGDLDVDVELWFSCRLKL